VLCNVVLKSLSSASENSSATDGSSSSQRPSRLQRFRNELSFARSAAVHIPDQAETRDSLSSSYSQNCLDLSLSLLSQFTFENCAAATNLKKTLKPLFWGSRSFKVIDVDTNKKLVTIACYGKQHVCAYLQPFSRYMSIAVK